MEINYVDPSVRVLDSSIPGLSYFMWLRSRQWVISDLKGKKFMVDFVPTNGWLSRIPNKFYVGTELVTKLGYFNRINKMNLQYNNMETCVFEIEGSCLFRDFLFNINKIGQWAQSNRFLFSILDETERLNPANYKVSSEYAGIGEWEAQFEKYMELIKSESVVDFNRLEMPYSISSTFWISVNKKTFLDILSFMKYRVPFLYEVYGKMLLDSVDLSESDIPKSPSVALTQYILKDMDNFIESNISVNGTHIVNSKMGLVLYSQFIRQADTKISGLYNELIHSDPDKFKHKVFKGGTVLNIQYVADIDKIKSTISTRMCAFAMSSGTGPDSWSYFINKFLPKGISRNPEEFLKLLPCKFSGRDLIDCPFRDDIKFRNEGKEISNCPCPIYTRSMANAEAKRDRDRNLIGEGFYHLTKYVLGIDGHTINMHRWTSDLSIRVPNLRDVPVKSLTEKIASKLDKLEDMYNNINNTEEISKLFPILSGIHGMFPNNDITSAMKGKAIDEISEILGSYGLNRYVINFGGDIKIKGYDLKVDIDGTNFKIDVTSDAIWYIMTSGNTSKRGNHVIGGSNDSFSTLIFKLIEGKDSVGHLIDAAVTKIEAKELDMVESIFYILSTKVEAQSQDLYFKLIDGEYKCQTSTYIASPFFNKTQIEIRDRMDSKFSTKFRPDLTKEAKEYNEGKEYDKVTAVVQSNKDAIINCELLVYPSRTTDLGTLWEVGYALFNDTRILRYDEELNEYVLIMNQPIPNPEVTETLFDCSNKVDAIMLGAVGDLLDSNLIYYQLKGSPDNIMLSAQYHHVELVNGEFIEYERDREDTDK